jgi:molybdopterin-binding protein
MKFSARNVLPRPVMSLRRGATPAPVRPDIGGGVVPGMRAGAVGKASDAMVGAA